MEKDSIELVAKKMSEKAIEKIEEVDGKNFRSCLMCGKCAASCSPKIREQMDLAPWRLINLLMIGTKEAMEQVLNSKTLWLCISCSACVSRCPMKINMPKIMEALRTIILREGIDLLDMNKISADILNEIPQMGIIAASRKLTE